MTVLGLCLVVAFFVTFGATLIYRAVMEWLFWKRWRP